MVFKSIDDTVNKVKNAISAIDALKASASNESTFTFDEKFDTMLNKDVEALELYQKALRDEKSEVEAMASSFKEASASARTYAETHREINIEDFKNQQRAAQVETAAQNHTLANSKVIIDEYNAILTDSAHAQEANYQALSKTKLSQTEYLEAVGKSNPELKKYLSSLKQADGTTKGYVGSLILAKAATIGLKTVTLAFKTVINSIIGMGIGALVQFALSGIQKIIEAVKEAHKTTEEKLAEIDKRLSETGSAVKQIVNDFRSLKQSADEVIPRFVELAAGVDEFGKNVKLTDKEYEEFISLNNKIAEMFPELNLGMDDNGNAMLSLSYSADTLKESLEALLEVQRQEANQQTASKLPEILDDVKKYEDETNDAIDNIRLNINRIQSGSYTKDTFGDAASAIADAKSIEEFYDYVDYLTSKGIEVTTKVENVLGTYAMTYTASWDTAATQTTNAVAGLEKEIDNLESKITSKWRSINPYVSAWLQSDFLFLDMSDEMQDVAIEAMRDFDPLDLGLLGENGEETAENIKSYITKFIINPLYTASPDIQDAVKQLFLNDGELSINEFESLANKIKEQFGEDNPVYLYVKTNLDDAGEMANTVKSFIDYEFDSSVDELSLDDLAIAASDEFWKFLNVPDGTLLSIDELNTKLKEYKGLTDSIEPLSFEGTLSKVNDLSSGLNELDKIYADIYNKADFDWGSILDNEAFTKAFSNLGDVYSNFIETVANSPTDIAACQEAFDSLTTAYLKQSGILDNVTDATRNATVAMLEQMGISNAAAIVDANLAYQKEVLKYTTGDYADMTYEEILELYNECEAGTVAKQVLAELTVQKALVNGNGIKTSSDVGQLIALANSANATTQSLENLANAKAMLAQAESLFASAKTSRQNYIRNGDQVAGEEWKHMLDEASALRTQAEELLNKPLEYNLIDADKFKASYSGSPATKSASGGSATKEETWFEKQYKLHQHLLDMDAENVEDYLEWLNSAYQQAYNEGIIDLDDFYKYQEEVYKGLQDLFKDYLNDIEHEISMRENFDGENKKIISLYKELIAAVEKEIAAARARGLDDTDEYIQELESKWIGYTNSIKDIENDVADSAKDALDELVDYRIDMLKKDIDSEKDALDEKLDYLKEFYDKQKDMIRDVYDEEKYLEEQSEKRKTITDIQAELAQLEFDDSAWAQKRKLELEQELADAQKELDDFEKEHALNETIDLLDDAYAEQEKQIRAEMDALEETLNDPEALYNRALSDIRECSGEIYNEMLEYNRRYGTGNDEDIIDMWEDAYQHLFEYFGTNGEWYKGVELANATGYSPSSGSWEESSIAGTNAPLTPLSSLEEKGIINSPDYWSQHSGDVAWLTSLIQALDANTGSAVTGNYTDVNSAIDALYAAGVINSPDYWKDACKKLAWLDTFIISATNHLKVSGYATGTRKATAGMHSIDEFGTETIFESADGTRYKMFSGGEKVLNAKASDFLYEFANGGGEILEKIIKTALGGGIFDKIMPIVNNNEINMGDIVINGDCKTQTVSEIRRAQRENVSNMLKAFNNLNK